MSMTKNDLSAVDLLRLFLEIQRQHVAHPDRLIGKSRS
ncbi:hypothetical protein J2W42_003035 [Rhizobium tibeticum]|nr:hypothetical protein [Rhizobium tibeticum]